MANHIYAQHQECFQKEGGFEAVVAAMIQNKDHFALQHSACVLLEMVKHMHHVPQNVLQSITQVVITCMNTHVSCPETHTAYLGVLGHVVIRVHAPSAQDTILKGRVKAMVECLRVSTHRIHVLGTGISSLFSIMRDKSLINHDIQKFWQCGMLDLALTTVEALAKLSSSAMSKRDLVWSADEVMGLACGVVAFIYSTSKTTHEEPRLHVIAKGMKKVPNMYEMQTNCILAILESITCNKRNCDHVCKEGLNEVLSAMTRHKQQSKLVTHGIFVCLEFAKHGVKWVAEEHVILMVVQAAKANMHDMALQERV